MINLHSLNLPDQEDPWLGIEKDTYEWMINNLRYSREDCRRVIAQLHEMRNQWANITGVVLAPAQLGTIYDQTQGSRDINIRDIRLE